MYRILIAILLLIYSCEEPGCTDPDACNYNPEATEDAGNCDYFKEGFCDCYKNIKDIWDVCGGGGPDSAYNVNGNCIFDWDNDGICDVFEETNNISDTDENNYQTVQIGSQLWLKENLQVTHYRNGDEIPLVRNSSEWGNLTSGAYCEYENSYTHSEKYGKLYNGYTVFDNRGICMDGWHVPFKSDWEELRDYIGEEGGEKIMSNTNDWTQNRLNFNNESNFTALPTGLRWLHGGYQGAGSQTGFWSSTEYDNPNLGAWRLTLEDGLGLRIFFDFKNYGYSVRCIRNISFIDIDGNHYETIQFGNQLWFTENLKATHYNNGDIISTGYTHEEWIELENGAYSVYPTDEDYASQTTCGDNCANVYGNLYNWYAVEDSRGICPAGSHVPTDIEWMELEMLLGMSEEEANSSSSESLRGTNEGSKLAGNTDLWKDDFYEPNFPELGGICANIDGICPLESDFKFGTSGFNALPGGWKIINGNYFMGYGASFWSSTQYVNLAWHRAIQINYTDINRNYRYKWHGSSIRCVAD